MEVIAAYDDLDEVRRFARAVRVVTFEFENVPAATAEAAAEYCSLCVPPATCCIPRNTAFAKRRFFPAPAFLLTSVPHRSKRRRILSPGTLSGPRLSR